MTKYEILTPSGWSSFDGIQKKMADKIYHIFTENGRNIECTESHLIKSAYGFTEAHAIVVGDSILTVNGYDKVSNIFTYNADVPVYDVLNVAKKNMYYTNGVVSHNCGFLGSSGTLISGQTLKNLVWKETIYENSGVKQYVKPTPNHSYVLIADVSRGKGLDYSAFSIIDVTKMPYQQVCTFRDNMTGAPDYATIIYNMGMLYNEASVMIEINDIGGQVADILFLDYGYENIIMTENAGRSGKRVSGGFGGKVDRGIVTSKTVKATGCSTLKMLIEQEQLIVVDFDTIRELSRFSKKGNSYEAEPGANDDTVMTLVLFAWLSTQGYFRDLTDIDTMHKLREKTDEQIMEELLPFGFIDNGMSDDDGWVNYPM